MVDIEKLHEALRNGVLKQNSTPFPALPQQTAPAPTSGFFASLGLPSDYSRDTGKSISSLQEEPSWISKFFDTLSAPLYGVYDAAENVADLAQGETNFGEFLKETGKTAAGTVGRIAEGLDETLIPGNFVPDAVGEWSEEAVPHRLGSDVLESLGVENKVAKYGGGFLMDVLADPLTYVGGVGLIGKGKNAKDAVKTVSPGSDPSLFTKPAEPPSAQEVGRAAKSEVDSASPFSTTPRGDLVPAPVNVQERLLDDDIDTWLFKGEMSPRLAEKVRTDSTHLPGTYYRGDIDRNLNVGDSFDYAEPKSFTADFDTAHDFYSGSFEDGIHQAFPSTEGRAIYQIVDPEGLPLRTRDRTGKRFSGESSESLLEGNFTVVDKVVENGNVIYKIQQTGRSIPQGMRNPINTTAGLEEASRRIQSDPAIQAFRNNANRKKGDYYPDAERANWVPLSEHKAAKAGKVAKSGPKGLKLYHETLRRMVADINAGVMPGPVITKTPVAPATGILKDEAENIFRTWAKEISTKASAKGHTELNPANQANIWNSIMNRVQKGMRNPEEAGLFTTKLMKDGTAYIKGSKTEQFNAGLSMLRAAEDAAIASGNVPQYWNGTRLRLSDLLHEIGPEGYKEHGTALIDAFKERDFSKISNPFVQAKIAELSARSAVKDSWIVDTARNYTERALSDLFDNLPPVQANAMVNNLPSEIEDMVRAAGLTKKEAAAVRDVARGVIGVNRDPLDTVLYNFGQALQKSKIDGKLDPKVVSAMNHKIQDMMKITPTDVSVRGKTHGVIGEIMLRMTTWWGRGEMKKFADNAFIAGELRAKARAEGIGNLLRNYSQQELQNAMRVAQGIFPAAGRTEKELEASRIIRDYFETVIGSSRLRNYKDYDGVTSFRSGSTMADVNKALKDLGSHFQFTTKPYKHPATGVKRNEFKESVDWTTSWEALDPSKLGYKNPAHLLYDIDLAMERVTNEYAMVDTFVNNFGARRTDRHFNPARHTTPLAHSRGGDYYFEKETVQQFNRLLKDIHDGLWKPNQPLVKHYARGLSSWKRGVTIYMSSHHVRNMIGDLHMTWWAGHNDPMDFIRARRVLGASRAQYKEVIQSGNIHEINKLIDPDAAAWNSTNATDVILRQGKHSLNAGEIYKAAFDRGLLLRAQQLEDLFGDSVQEAMAGGTGLRRFLKQPLGGKAHDTASNLSEYRDHFVRLHHFIAAINKEMKKGKKSKRDLDFNKIFDDAANEVRKWHPDGRDLTQFEQKARLAIPFYSWTRKALPLMVQSAVQKPAKITYAPKAVAALQGVAGIETDNPILDPFPDDQLFPEWIRASGIGPIGAAHSDNPWTSFWGRLGRNLTNPFGEYGYTVINPGNPFIDTAEQHIGSGSFQDLLSGVMGMTTPAFQIPSNLYANETGIGRPIMGDEPGAMGLGQYAAEQVPILAPIQNVLEVGRDQKPNIDNTFDYQALMNYLTAAGITGTSPYIKSAEFEVKG